MNFYSYHYMEDEYIIAAVIVYIGKEDTYIFLALPIWLSLQLLPSLCLSPTFIEKYWANIILCQ